MALFKEVEYKGVVCSYHKIVQIDVDFYTPAPNLGTYSKMDVGVALYKDAASRGESVENILRVKQYHFNKSDESSPDKEEIDKVYEALKELDEFEGAEDV